MEKKTLKTEEAQNYILRYIHNHNLKPADQLPTERELIEAIGFSRITIRKALANLQAQGILRTVQGKGAFVCDISNLHSDSANPLIASICLLITNLNNNPRYYELIQGIEAFLENKPYQLSVSTIPDMENPNIPSKVFSETIKSIIVLPSDRNTIQSSFFHLSNSNKPVIFIDAIPGNINGHLVTSDNVMGGYMATKHLLEQGVTNIVPVFPYDVKGTNAPTHNRYIGYQLAYLERGLKPFCDPVSYNGNSNGSFESTLLKMLETPQKPEAIFALNDIVAAGVSSICTRRNIRIPEDLAIVGYDDLPLCVEQPVPLSSIRQDYFKIGYHAARLACESIASDEKLHQQLFIPVKLIPRASTEKK